MIYYYIISIPFRPLFLAHYISYSPLSLSSLIFLSPFLVLWLPLYLCIFNLIHYFFFPSFIVSLCFFCFVYCYSQLLCRFLSLLLSRSRSLSVSLCLFVSLCLSLCLFLALCFIVSVSLWLFLCFCFYIREFFLQAVSYALFMQFILLTVALSVLLVLCFLPFVRCPALSLSLSLSVSLCLSLSLDLLGWRYLRSASAINSVLL